MHSNSSMEYRSYCIQWWLNCHCVLNFILIYQGFVYCIHIYTLSQHKLRPVCTWGPSFFVPVMFSAPFDSIIAVYFDVHLLSRASYYPSLTAEAINWHSGTNTCIGSSQRLGKQHHHTGYIIDCSDSNDILRCMQLCTHGHSIQLYESWALIIIGYIPVWVAVVDILAIYGGDLNKGHHSQLVSSYF